MKLVKEYKDLTTVVTEYVDNQGNEFIYEDGDLVYTNIFGVETNYSNSTNEPY